MRFPSIKTVAAELRGYKQDLRAGRYTLSPNDPNGEEEQYLDVRLQVHEDGDFALHGGDPQYDQDHRGYWGAGLISRSTNCYDLARELLEEAKHHYVQYEPLEPCGEQRRPSEADLDYAYGVHGGSKVGGPVDPPTTLGNSKGDLYDPSLGY